MKKRVLVIDDDMHVLRSLSKLLTIEGYDVKKSDHAESVLDCINNDEFDIVIVDLNLPGMDGIEVLKLVKERNTNAVVFILTGSSCSLSITHAKELGVDDYILKPVMAKDLLNRIKVCLN